MATETTVIDIKIADAQAAGSIKDLKKSLKELINELQNVPAGSKEFEKLTKTINDTEGKIGDLTDSFNTLKGSGIERTTSSMGLLREGFQNFDVDKIKIGFKGLGAAMSAVPIFLLVEGVKALIENFDAVVNFFKQFTAAAKEVKRLNDELERQKQVTSALVHELNREIEVMEAQGKSHDLILKKKKELRQAQIDEAFATAKLNIAKAREVLANDSISESIDRTAAALARSTGSNEIADKLDAKIANSKSERLKEYKQATIDSLELIKDLQNKGKVEEIKFEQEKRAEYKKTKDDKLKTDKETADNLFDQLVKNQDAIDAQNKAAKDRSIADANDLFNELSKIQDDETKKTIEENKKRKKSDEEREAYKLTLEKQGFAASKALSDLFFQIQLNQAAGNEKKQLEIKKRAFQVDKAFQVAQASIDGYRAVLSAYATAPVGFKIASAALAATFAAAQVAKILATKFDGGNTGGAGGGSDNSTPQGPPTTNQPINTTAPTTQSSTTFDSNGRNQNINVTANVYEGEMSSAQKRSAKLERQATI